MVHGTRAALIIAAADRLPGLDGDRFDLVIAADGGADLALESGLEVDVLVGDMDSISEEALTRVKASGARIVEHPTSKDETDLELALELAVSEADRIHVVVGSGGRLDHSFVNLAVLSSPRWAAALVDASVGDHSVTVIRGSRELDAPTGSVLSLIPVGGPARVVATTGLAYELAGEELDPQAGRGISNVVISSPVRIDIAEGVLLAIRPLGR